ncbi:MAG: PHP domain-containing protein [Anaerolineae bacterium]|nr:PHP domain-containing protein [Anaerolineae bacterium]
MIAFVKRFYELTGNLHVHTVYSDGTGSHRKIARAAAQAGLDFVVATDHNIWVDGVEGYYDDALLLVGEEVHHVRRRPGASHLLVYGAEAEMAPYAAEPQELVDEANRRGGLCFLAHPFERSSPLGSHLAAIPWEDWSVTGYLGLELWNAMSEFKGLLWSRPAALFYAYFPALGIQGPYRATLRKWDELLAAGQKVTPIAGADAHARTYRMGPFRRCLFPYRELFRWVNTHLLIERPLQGDLAGDKQLIYHALRDGRTWVGYDRIASTRGFRFQARSLANEATLGDELVRTGATVFEVEAPTAGDIRLLRDGQLVARSRGTLLRFTSAEAGIYRAEVYRFFCGQRRGWIFSGPIYVR